MTTVVSLSSYDYAVGPWALRLTGQASSLSALSERAVLRRLRFHLWLLEEAGDEEVWEEEADAQVGRSAGSRSQGTTIFEWAGRGEEFADLAQLVQDYVQRYLDCPDLTPSQRISQGGMTLAPVGLTRHRLTVAHPTAAVNLSLLQLADLAAVLAQAEQAVDILPETVVASRWRWSRPQIPLWTGSVAAVLVAAVLGSQWLLQTPPTMVQTPAPTAETRPSEDDLAAGADAASIQADVQDAASPEAQSFASGDAAQGSGATAEGIAAGDPPSLATEDPGEGSNLDRPTVPRSTPATPARPPQPQPTERSAATPGALPPAANSPRFPTVMLPPAQVPSPPPSLPTEDRLAPSPTASVPEALAPPSPSAARQATPPDPVANPSADSAPGPMGTTALESGAGTLTHGANAEGVEAVRSLLQQRWQPIPGLASPLRYRLTLGPTGEVLTWEPLTAPARQYLSQEKLPSTGDVLPNVRLASPIVLEVNLQPSGEVQVLILDASQP